MASTKKKAPPARETRAKGRAARDAEATEAQAVGADDAAEDEVSSADRAEGDAALAAVEREAGALPESEVREVTVPAALAVHNARLGVESVLEKRSELSARLRSFDEVRVSHVHTLALAYGAASRRVVRQSPNVIAEIFTELSALRKIALGNAVSAMHAKLVPAGAVQRIKKGTGKLDAAKDAIDLAALFQAHSAALRNKTMLSAAQLARLEELGRKLTDLVTPKGGKKKLAPEVRAALDLRNRVGTLLLRAWDELWRLGALAYGPAEINARVPSLLSATRKQKKRATKDQNAAGSPTDSP